MGVVYAAYDAELERKIALKLIRPETAGAEGSRARARLLREAQAMARLSHPNVIAVYDVGAVGDQVFVAMELVEGESLGHWLTTEARAQSEILEVFQGAGLGLAAAHRAGLVHRDFKPENVLLGKDGRVRVADFGLAGARSGGGTSAEPAAGRGLLAAPLTRTGTQLGTPRYMAPEQHQGKAADPRTDQFSFCVSLYEALYGEPPFSGETTEELAREVARGRVRAAPAESHVPPWLRRLLLRGLSADPAARFPSMEDLLSVLARDPRRIWRRRFAVAGGVAGVAAAIVASLHSGEDRSLLCSGAAAKLAGIWDAGTKQAVQAAFLATGKRFARDAWRGTERMLDAYGHSWVAMHTEACEATRVRGEQSEAILDLRMQCLEQRRKEVRALVDLLTRADGEVVDRAMVAASALTDLGSCRDLARLGARFPPPAPGKRAKVEEIRTTLARLKAYQDAGKIREAITEATSSEASARRLGYLPIQAEFLRRLGEVQRASGKNQEAERTLYDAVLAAQAAGHDQEEVRGWAELAWLAGVVQANPLRARRFARHARAVLKRVGGHAELESKLESTFGGLLVEESRYQEALPHFRHVVEIERAEHGPNHLHPARALTNLGIVLRAATSFRESLAVLQEALRVLEGLQGPDHRFVGYARDALGVALLLTGRYQEALGEFRKAVPIHESGLGGEHPEVALALINVARALMAQRKPQKALSATEGAVRILEKAGPRHPYVVWVLAHHARALRLLGRTEEARACLSRALRVGRKVLPAKDADLGLAELELGELLLEQHRHAEALRHYATAVAILRNDAALLVDALLGEGEARLAIGLPRQAAASLERALSVWSSPDADPAKLVRIRFALARALWGAGDRRRAVVLCHEARSALAKWAPPGDPELKRIDAWLRDRK
jgi:tetratricopeptide (TPR) repeat protein